MNEIIKYSCPRCGGKQYEIGEIWAVGSLLTRIFEIHNRKFTFISCLNCRYTELFKVPRNKISETYNLLSH